MGGKTIIKRIFIICCILLLSFGMFIGGMMLTERYKTTIVTTYNKYYDKYHNQAEGYLKQINDEIHRNIELASQNTNKK
ncbi:MAG: hypothetical protein J1F17_00500 [Oscillospiraceae bacterium]|nr:hypothetical protein [Oscillospiraceae bacterium]